MQKTLGMNYSKNREKMIFFMVVRLFCYSIKI